MKNIPVSKLRKKDITEPLNVYQGTGYNFVIDIVENGFKCIPQRLNDDGSVKSFNSRIFTKFSELKEFVSHTDERYF